MQQLQIKKFSTARDKEISIPAGAAVAAELEVVAGAHAVAINLGENSSLMLSEVQNIPGDEKASLDLRISLARNSSLSHAALCAFGKEISIKRNFDLHEGAEVNFANAFFGNREQKFIFNTTVNHSGRNSKSDLRTYGILRDAAQCVSHGNIKIEKAGQGSNAFLADHSLLLDKKARAESIPALEILANDVRAGHSASTTRLSPEQLFYCTSRGLNELEAIKIIASGFLARAFAKVDAGSIMELVEEKWKE